MGSPGGAPYFSHGLGLDMELAVPAEVQEQGRPKLASCGKGDTAGTFVEHRYPKFAP